LSSEKVVVSRDNTLFCQSHLINGKPSKLACPSGAKALVFQVPERHG
jgi:hypothetical protein